MRIGILHHPHKPESVPLAEEISAWLLGIGHQAWMTSTWDETEVHTKTAESDLLVVLGGDGSILRAARFAVPYNTPILGVNMGRVGFLSETEPDRWQQTLTRYIDGDWWLEKRLMLRAELWREGEHLKEFVALNDVVISGTMARVIRLTLEVDGAEITTYTADSLIAATPTGSTAYSMAAGGPLLPPELRNFLLMPVAPYLSLDRAVVLHENAKAEIHLNLHHDAILTADGQETEIIKNNDRIVISKHADEASFVRFDNKGYFYHRLMKRLGFERKS